MNVMTTNGGRRPEVVAHASARILRLAVGLLCVLPFSFLRPPSLNAQQTRAERSNYSETSTYTDVIAFLDSLERAATTGCPDRSASRTERS